MSCTAEEKLHLRTASDISENSPDPLQYWIQTERWRREYFEQDSQVREDFERGKLLKEFEQRDWLQEHFLKEPFRSMHSFHPFQYLFARKKSSSFLCHKNSKFSLQTPSNQLPQKVKSAQYRTVEYEIGLKKKSSYMCKFNDNDISENIKILCKNLLKVTQALSQNSLFHDDLFKKTCEKIWNRNEAMIIWDISSLIVSFAQTLVTYGVTHLNHLYECINKDWNSVISFYDICLQPDHSVRFRQSAFTEKQLKKLKSFVSKIEFKALIYFIVITQIYFLFLICKIKCSTTALNVADQQNIHSITVVVKALVKLFRFVKCKKELY